MTTILDKFWELLKAIFAHFGSGAKDGQGDTPGDVIKDTPDVKGGAIPRQALDIIKKWEGFRSKAYLDPVGIPTIGYGTIKYPNGKRVQLGEEITEPEAAVFLRMHIEDHAVPYVKRYVKVPLNENQYSAILSFIYNLGAGAFRKSTLLKKLNAGDYNGAAAEFDRWVYAGGKKLQGLINRRNDEQALFKAPVKVIG